VALGLDVGPKEIVIGDADALEGLDQQSDDVGYDQFVVSLRQPVAVQFPAVAVAVAPLRLTSIRNGFSRPDKDDPGAALERESAESAGAMGDDDPVSFARCSRAATKVPRTRDILLRYNVRLRPVCSSAVIWKIVGGSL
jgi:hypothetical protein